MKEQPVFAERKSGAQTQLRKLAARNVHGQTPSRKYSRPQNRIGRPRGSKHLQYFRSEADVTFEMPAVSKSSDIQARERERLLHLENYHALNLRATLRYTH